MSNAKNYKQIKFLSNRKRQDCLLKVKKQENVLFNLKFLIKNHSQIFKILQIMKFQIKQIKLDYKKQYNRFNKNNKRILQ